MPYFPTEEEQKYYCPNCKAWFIPGSMSCCVMHYPGDCCHEFEKRTDPPAAALDAKEEG